MSLALTVIIVLLFSAFFSGSEIAFISASRIGVELKRKTGSRRGSILSSFYDKPDRFLGIMLVGNNIALVIFAILMTRIIDPLLMKYVESPTLLLLGNTLITTVVVLIFGEFLPKTIFRIYANNLMYFFAYVHALFRWLLGAPALLMTYTSNLILKYVLKMPITSSTNVFTRLDLESFVEVKTKGGEDDMETDMFKNALHLQSVKVRECMVPRTEVVDIDVNASYEEYIELFQETRLSRLIVSEDEVDNILGYVHHLQFLNNVPSVRDIVMDIPFVPEAMSAQELMVDFMKRNTNIACVVDEFGGLAGIITMEDILEEIFGEIEDEHDVDDYVEQQISEKEFLFSGRLEIDYLNEKYEQIDIPDGDYETLSGYLVMTTERIPEEGDEIDLGEYRFVLTQVSETKIEIVRLIKLDM